MTEQFPDPLIPVRQINWFRISIVFCTFVLVATAILAYIFLFRAPDNFPHDNVITIKKGDTVQEITLQFKDLALIRSSFVFRSFIILLGGEKRVVAGDYLFSEREHVLSIALRIINGDFHMEEIKVTIPEGSSVKEIGTILSRSLVSFNVTDFITHATKKEGYLFPDTYFFPPSASSDDIISRMNGVYKNKIQEFEKSIAASGRTEKEILTMASILEGEAQTSEDRRIVAGILWNRIAKGMPLQVDATFAYINGKTTKDLTLDDLKIDSPYNTYVYKGLPPGPINNPGSDAIKSALTPVRTAYVYFLTGKDGNMYYAKTFEEHKRNKDKYLR